MACTAFQQRRLRQPSASSMLLTVLLLLLLAAFVRPSSGSRPLPLDGGARPGSSNVILLHLPTGPAAAAAGAGAEGAPTTTQLMPSGEEGHGHQLAAGQWLLSRKPRVRAPPSAPSKRTN